MKNWHTITLVIMSFYFNQVNSQFTSCLPENGFEEIGNSQCATFKVPLDHQFPEGETLDLFVRKFPSIQKSQGSVWLISGGPGESGASLYPLIQQFKALFPNMDIYVPDHRGTGLSSKICPEQEAVTSTGGIALAGEEWGACFGYMFQNQTYVQAFSITNAAKDLRFLINEMSGQGKRYVYGVSYGTQLVLRMLQLGNMELDALILDSLVPLQKDEAYDLSQRSQVTEDVGRQVLDRFQKMENHKDITLMEQMKIVLERSKKDSVFLKKLPQQDLTNLFGVFLDIPSVRNRIPEIIKSLYKEDFEPLNSVLTDIQQFYASFAKYGTSPSSIPLAQVISSSENNLRTELTKEEIERESVKLLFTSPLPQLLAGNSLPTYQRDDYFGKVPTKLPPTLVVHGTLDPKTHLEGALKHVELLSQDNSVNLVKIKNAPHFIAFFAPDAFQDAVAAFLQGNPLILEMDDEHVKLKSLVNGIPAKM
jgi:pimeloyl-ACP methyl ester carboxylesterase